MEKFHPQRSGPVSKATPGGLYLAGLRYVAGDPDAQNHYFGLTYAMTDVEFTLFTARGPDGYWKYVGYNQYTVTVNTLKLLSKPNARLTLDILREIGSRPDGRKGYIYEGDYKKDCYNWTKDSLKQLENQKWVKLYEGTSVESVLGEFKAFTEQEARRDGGYPVFDVPMTS